MTVLLLAGTGEARRIAWALADGGPKIVASLAGATRHPEPLPVPTHVGGFGGADGFEAFLEREGIEAVLDATHPFAAKITARSAKMCSERGLPYALVRRPGWTAATGDHWQRVAGPSEVAPLVPEDATVFLATGRQTLADYAELEGRRVLARIVDPPTAPFPFEGGEFVIGRPPFSVEREVALFKSLGVTHLVAKDAGGAGGRAKLDAARKLGVSVILIERPPVPDVTVLEDVQAAVDWAAAIWGRMEAAGMVTEAACLAASEDALRGLGLSRQKIRYTHALAGAGIDYVALREAPDAEVISTLVAVPGIGPWTAEIYAMFSLGRADVFAPGDLALQEAAQLLYDLPDRPKEGAFRKMAEDWSPWRSVAARLLWAYYRVAKEREGIR